MQEVVKKEIVKLLDTGIIYLIADSPWVSPIQCVPKKRGITVVTNENDELVPTRTIMGWRVCIDYRKLNEATVKDHFPLPFMDQMYIPELKRNLISLGTLEKEGYIVKLQSRKVKVINGSRVILSGIRRDNCVYSLDGHAMTGELNASIKEKHNLAQVWHKRLGHISEAGLPVLEKQGLFGKKSLGLAQKTRTYQRDGTTGAGKAGAVWQEKSR
nr:reverse transcriptase domain-containing protein [Tanacetum cinerariifolium]